MPENLFKIDLSQITNLKWINIYNCSVGQNLIQITQSNLSITYLKLRNFNSNSDCIISVFKVSLEIQKSIILDSFPCFLFLKNSSLLMNECWLINNHIFDESEILKINSKDNNNPISINNSLFYQLNSEKSGGV